MFNQTGITKTNGMAPTQILMNTQLQLSMGVIVSKDIDESAITTENGRNIVKAGTPLSGSLDARTTAFVLGDSTNSATGVLLHDVDVTSSNANATLLIFGFVNTNRLSSTAKALITDDVKTALDAKVTFVAA